MTFLIKNPIKNKNEIIPLWDFKRFFTLKASFFTQIFQKHFEWKFWLILIFCLNCGYVIQNENCDHNTWGFDKFFRVGKLPIKVLGIDSTLFWQSLVPEFSMATIHCSLFYGEVESISPHLNLGQFWVFGQQNMVNIVWLAEASKRSWSFYFCHPGIQLPCDKPCASLLQRPCGDKPRHPASSLH